MKVTRIPKLFQTVNQSLLNSLAVVFVEEVASQFLRVFLIGSHMINDHQEGMPDRDGHFLCSSPENKAMVLSRKGGVFAMRRRMCRALLFSWSIPLMNIITPSERPQVRVQRNEHR